MNILIVGDESMLAQVLEQILQSEGHFTDVVEDGATALIYADDFSYDLVILDVMLPLLDGFGVARAMREHGNNTPILMLTARTSVQDTVTGLNAGADDYMTKPFEAEELLARVNALTRRSGEIVMKTLSFADVTLELNSALLRCGHGAVQLSHKELGVAKMFLANPTMTLTKDMLISNVWGGNANVTDNNVESYISFLRKKLKYLKSRVIIKNIPKLGYRLEVSECCKDTNGDLFC
ncbi:MAG: response regulator transcription factor [Oscillospiraceae bacterium]|nr:response regulator transcription factor [Oscillospiraceae bacterium]